MSQKIFLTFRKKLNVRKPPRKQGSRKYRFSLWIEDEAGREPEFWVKEYQFNWFPPIWIYHANWR